MWSAVVAPLLLLLVSTAIDGLPRTDVTVSGISSGGAMAAQLHIVFSQDISACGIVTGIPYYCSRGNIMNMNACMNGPATLISVSSITNKINSYASSALIDKVDNLSSNPIYIFHGKSDHTIAENVVKVNEQIYKPYNVRIKTNYDTMANHGFVTDNYGGKCEILESTQYINNCNFNLAYDMLNYLYSGHLIKPSTTSTILKGKLLEFDQNAFIDPPLQVTTTPLKQQEQRGIFDLWSQWVDATLQLYNPVNYLPSNGTFFGFAFPTTTSFSNNGFDKTGYLYVPSGCSKGKNCSIHVALHGCKQGKTSSSV
ncbi:unnamed protein product [Didymodactylos carnosus]|uniref:Carboxylic ester hydrolase n=1 Tax=Didymodactylos carnosus TaxID=1234261 RepID=A0A815FQK3_9BILA|nr:unnamed protein product [Didymodactylos carnosus]CAF4182196.1 unnamed protein product [Didymodactylos carnosus]